MAEVAPATVDNDIVPNIEEPEAPEGCSCIRGPQKIIFNKGDVLSISDVWLRCQAPRFHCCGFGMGCAVCCCGGCPLYACSCCYSCDRPDCMNVVLAGILMTITGPCCYGIGAQCVVGGRMMKCCKQSGAESVEISW